MLRIISVFALLSVSLKTFNTLSPVKFFRLMSLGALSCVKSFQAAISLTASICFNDETTKDNFFAKSIFSSSTDE